MELLVTKEMEKVVVWTNNNINVKTKIEEHNCSISRKGVLSMMQEKYGRVKNEETKKCNL